MSSNDTQSAQQNDSPLKGQCHCGAISYILPLPPPIEETSVPGYDFYKNNVVPPSKQKYPERGVRPNSNKWKASHCHCGACRRTVGALCVEWMSVPINQAVITRNGPTGKYRASNKATREFCQTCGTSLFFVEDDGDEIDVTLGSFTTPNLFDYIEFNAHIWVEDAAHLILDEEGKGGGTSGIINDGLPRYTQNRESKLYVGKQ